MTQHSFNFSPPPNKEAAEIQKWVDQHNQQVINACRPSFIPAGSLLSALDKNDAKSNAVYLLRGLIGQLLRKSTVPASGPLKEKFLHSLRAEMTIKRTSQNPAFSLRASLIKSLTSP